MNLSITPEQLPTGVCPSDLQSIWNLFAAYGSVVVPDSSGKQWVFSATKPSDQTVGWFQLDTLGRPIRPYLFAQGAWLSLHSKLPGECIWWYSTLPNFSTFDGGDANPISDVSGAMWQQAQLPNGTSIVAQFPIVAGTLPSGKVLNLGDVGGEEVHSLTVPEMPPHAHSTTFDSEPQTGADTFCLIPRQPPIGTHQATIETSSTGGSGTPPVVQGHNTLPVYAVGYLLQRTARKYYAVT